MCFKPVLLEVMKSTKTAEYVVRGISIIILFRLREFKNCESLRFLYLLKSLTCHSFMSCRKSESHGCNSAQHTAWMLAYFLLTSITSRCHGDTGYGPTGMVLVQVEAASQVKNLLSAGVFTLFLQVACYKYIIKVQNQTKTMP